MDITPGEFKDFYPRSSVSSARSSRSESRVLFQNNATCSMELLSPEIDEKLNDNEGNSSNTLENDYELSSKIPNERPGLDLEDSSNRSRGSVVSRRLVSCSLSSHSSSSLSEITDEHNDSDYEIKPLTNENTEEVNEQDVQLQDAIKRMNKLDKILMKKMKHEKEVKRQRMEIQKHFHSEIAKIQAEKEGGTYADVSSNTAKYLALLPPPQQLDVLIERNESTEEFEPFFQTQIHSAESFSKSQMKQSTGSEDDMNTGTSTHRSRSAQGFSENSSNNSKEASSDFSKPSSAGSRGHKKDSYRGEKEKKTDFIKRNIELAKDAGNYVLMTEEEKNRVNELLKDLDKLDLDSNQEEDAFTQLATTSSGEGYTPEPQDITKLSEIDDRLRNLLSPAVYRSISSTPRTENGNHNYLFTHMMEAGKRIAKSNLTEMQDPSKKMQEIEEKLLKLDAKWKDEFDTNGLCLSENQLQRLLHECSRSTSPNSFTTSQFSKLDFYENDDERDSSPTISHRSSSTLCAESDSVTPSPRSENIEFLAETEISSDATDPPKLSREILDDLLHDARISLGLSSPPPPSDTMSSDGTESISLEDEEPQNIVNLDEDLSSR